MGALTVDAIVIGSGLGALAAAATVAARGEKVLVLERLANFGGAATTYRHDHLTVEASLHEIDGHTVFSPHGAFSRLGLLGTVDPIKSDVFYEVRAACLEAPIQVPHGLEAAREAVKAALPDSRKALERYFDEVTRLHHSLTDLEELGARGPMALVGLVFSGRLFDLIAEARRTLGQRLDAIFHKDEAAKFVLGAPLSYFDDDPAALDFLLYAGVWARYVAGGSYYFRGGSQALTLSLLHRIKERGGMVQRKADVVRIVLDDKGQAAGVIYRDEDGREVDVRAPMIFGGPAPDHLARMLPEEARLRFSRHFEMFEPSISLFTLALGLEKPASAFGISAYSTFVYPDGMKTYADFPKAAAVFGTPPMGDLPPYVLADFSRLDTGLHREGDPYLLLLGGVDRFAWWQDLDEDSEMTRRKAWTDALLADLDRRFPGLAASVQQAQMATSRTMQNRLGTPGGAVYGFRPTPARLFSRPPSAATPIPGLWLASAYTVSGGYSGALHGGLMAADAALRHRQ